MGMTYTQKLLAKACGKDAVAVGDILELPVHLAMSHENAALVINQFKEIYAEENLSVEEEDPAGFACFEQSGEKMHSVWLKIRQERS